MSFNRLLAALTALALFFAACGDDDDATEAGDAAADVTEEGTSSGEPSEYSDAVVEVLSAEGEIPFEDEDVECLAIAFIDVVGGPDALREAGVTPEDIADSDGPGDVEGIELPDDVNEQFVDAFESCDIDLTELILQFFQGAPDEVLDCVRENIDREALRELIAAGITDAETDAESRVEESVSSCA